MAILMTNLFLCATCIDDETYDVAVDGPCDCTVPMKVCDVCRRGPLNDSDPDVCEDCG